MVRRLGIEPSLALWACRVLPHHVPEGGISLSKSQHIVPSVSFAIRRHGPGRREAAMKIKRYTRVLSLLLVLGLTAFGSSGHAEKSAATLDPRLGDFLE